MERVLSSRVSSLSKNVSRRSGLRASDRFRPSESSRGVSANHRRYSRRKETELCSILAYLVQVSTPYILCTEVHEIIRENKEKHERMVKSTGCENLDLT